MLFGLSVLLVFGTVAVFVTNVVLGDRGQLGFGFEQMIHARIPWLLLVPVVVGSALGMASLVRRRTWYRSAFVGLEVAICAFALFYFTSFSFLPAHELAVKVGDPLPSFSLGDQDGNVHTVEASAERRPALYIFYRGDW
jgi:hypothetical protein